MSKIRYCNNPRESSCEACAHSGEHKQKTDCDMKCRLGYICEKTIYYI